MKNTLTHCRERAEFRIALQFSAKVYSDAASNEDSRCKGSGGQGMEKFETILAWNVRKVKSKMEVIKEAQKNNNKVHFALFMDLCHLKNSELEPQFQKYKRRVVLRGDILKDDSAVFTEQGSSASRMTAAEVMDVIARPPDCDGQAADAISAYTQVKMEDHQKLLIIPKSECPDVWIRLPTQKLAKVIGIH